MNAVTNRFAVATGSTRNIAERWRDQYWNSVDGWRSTAITRDTRGVYDALVALGPTPRIADVERIIGNQSWTAILCFACHTYQPRCVQVDPFGGGAVFAICEPCIAEAQQAFDAGAKVHKTRVEG